MSRYQSKLVHDSASLHELPRHVWPSRSVSNLDVLDSAFFDNVDRLEIVRSASEVHKPTIFANKVSVYQSGKPSAVTSYTCV